MPVFDNALSNLTDCFYQVPLFELCESPVSVSFMSMAVVLFSLKTNLDGFSKQRVHVVNKGEIVVRVRVSIVYLNTLFEMFNRFAVHLNFKVCKS